MAFHGHDNHQLRSGELAAAQRLLSIRSRLLHPTIINAIDHPHPASNNVPLATSSTTDLFELKDYDLVKDYSLPITCECLTKRQVFKLLESLYRDHPGAVWRAMSRRALEAQKGKEQLRHLVYGEISFIALENLLKLYVPLFLPQISKPTSSNSAAGITFYDLGCGSGRAVFTASLLHTNIAKSCGVEILPGMHRMNQELLHLYQIEICPSLHTLKQSQNVMFLCGDFLQVDWSDADIVFTNATCFDDCLFEKLELRASTILKEGSIVISVTRSFLNEQIWEVLEQQERRMSWSSAMVFVHRKRAAPTSTLQSSSSSML